MRRRNGIYERGRLVVGEPGIGKSVLVNRIAREARRFGDLVTEAIRIAADDDPVARVVAALQGVAGAEDLDARLGQRSRDLLRRIEAIRLPVVGGGVDLASPEPVDHRDLRDLTVALAGLAQEDGRLLIVHVDEVQNLHGNGLSALVTGLFDALAAEVVDRDVAGVAHERVLPIALYLSGLPEFSLRASAARATFSRRLKILDLEPLTPDDIRFALRPFLTEGWPIVAADGPEALTMSPDAVEAIVRSCHGSPYLLQLFGDAAWLAGSRSQITVEDVQQGAQQARREVRAHFELLLADLTEAQVAYLRAAASLAVEERSAGAIACALGRTSSSEVGYISRALEGRYRLVRRVQGRLEFRAPGLAAYLRDELP